MYTGFLKNVDTASIALARCEKILKKCKGTKKGMNKVVIKQTDSV